MDSAPDWIGTSNHTASGPQWAAYRGFASLLPRASACCDLLNSRQRSQSLLGTGVAPQGSIDKSPGCDPPLSPGRCRSPIPTLLTHHTEFFALGEACWGAAWETHC